MSIQDNTRIDFADVKAASLRSLDFIIPRLLPGGKRQGDEWVVRNPTRNDSKPGSFCVNMKTGVWSDFATGEFRGRHDRSICLPQRRFERPSEERTGRHAQRASSI